MRMHAKLVALLVLCSRMDVCARLCECNLKYTINNISIYQSIYLSTYLIYLSLISVSLSLSLSVYIYIYYSYYIHFIDIL